MTFYKKYINSFYYELVKNIIYNQEFKMAKTYDCIIKRLDAEKSELDLSFLQSKKQEYEEKMYEILDTQDVEIDESNAIIQLNKIKCYRANIKEIEKKIQNNAELLEKINDKILFYQERKNKVKNIPLYKDTEEWIAEILWFDTLYQYAKETKNEDLIQKIKKRSLTSCEYLDLIWNMYSDLFAQTQKKKNKKTIAQQAPKVIILLPEWMSEQIREDLKDSKEILPQEIESFLKKELKKNAWEIKFSHIKNTFKDKANQAYQYIKRLIINYPGFIIIDNSENKNSTLPTQSKRDKLISSISSQEKENIKSKTKKDDLLKKLLSVWNSKDLGIRIDTYLRLFEKIGCKFSDKDDFAINLHDAIIRHTHVQIEKEILKILTSIIEDNQYPIKTEKYWYLAYKFSRSCDNWRIVLYPNGEIFKICSHDEYERIISSQPPIDKRNNT